MIADRVEALLADRDYQGSEQDLLEIGR